MKGTINTRGRQQGWRIAGWSVAGLILILPAVAMRLGGDVHWTASDFAVAALLLGGLGGTLELVARRGPNLAYRAGATLALIAALLLIWINGAVGIIGDEDNPLNLLYLGLIAVALIGGGLGRFRPRAMARAMTAAATAQALVGVVAVIAGGDMPPGPLGLILLNGFFVLLLGGAALLFRAAARGNA